MTASLRQLLAVRSRFADEIVAFCDEAIGVLDATPFHFRDPNDDGASRAISISGTVIDARVFTWREKASDHGDEGPGSPRSRDGDKADAPATEYEKKLADLNEQPWRAEGRKSIPWSRALDRANRQRPLRPLVVRSAPGGDPVALDSLDEVVAKDEPGFCDRAPRLLHLHSPLVLTCRVLEWTRWESRLGWAAVDPVELAPFTAREQRDFTRRFFEEEIKRPGLLSGIRQQLTQKPALSKACESPIHLFFACLLHAGGELTGAATRTELYELMSRRLFRGEWRGLAKPPKWANGGAREFHVIAWLCEIAFALFRAVPEAKEFALSVWEEAVGDPNAIAAAGKVFPQLHPGALLEDLERCGFLVATGWRNRQPPLQLPASQFPRLPRRRRAGEAPARGVAQGSDRSPRVPARVGRRAALSREQS